MRKNISTYNHQRFAQTNKAKQQNKSKPKFNNPAYVAELLKNPNDKEAGKKLAFLAVRAVVGDDKLKIIPKEPKDLFDKVVYTKENLEKFNIFLNSLTVPPNVNQVVFRQAVSDASQFILSKTGINLQNQNQNQAQTSPAQPPVNQQVPAAPNVLSPAQAAELERPKMTPEQADKYLSNIIPILKALSTDKQKAGEFVQRYSNEFNSIVESMGILRYDQKFFSNLENYNKDFKALGPIYNDIMHPTGYSTAGNTVFVNDWYTLGDKIIKNVQSLNAEDGKSKMDKIEEAKKNLFLFQQQFLDKNPKNTDISGVANKVNQFVDQYNSGFGSTVQISKLPRLK